MQKSTYNPFPQPRRLPKDAPNTLIVLIDDSGPALPETCGGGIDTPAQSRIAETGLSFNRFHTTAMCSPTRAALLTGRNHHRVGAGVFSSLGNDWDGYTGVWPATCASVAKVLGQYGYATFQQCLNEFGGHDTFGGPLFEIMYHDGLMASTFGPRIPWKPVLDPAIFKWTPDNGVWELHDLRTDHSQPGAPAEVVNTLDGDEVAHTTVQRTVPAAFTARATFDVGVDLGSPVSLAYVDPAPFPFGCQIKEVCVDLK